MKATAKDLRIRSKDLLDAVSRGEEITITYRGKPRAKMIPIEKRSRKVNVKQSLAFGLWKDHKLSQEPEQFIDELRKSRFK